MRRALKTHPVIVIDVGISYWLLSSLLALLDRCSSCNAAAETYETSCISGLIGRSANRGGLSN